MASNLSYLPDLQSGLFHCTSVRNFRLIRRDGFIRPNLGDRAYQHGVTRSSRCFRIGAISLFDVAADPRKSWLWTWLTTHKPVTIAIKIDSVQLDPSKLISCAEARKITAGVMLPGEVCYKGEIPLSSAPGFLLVWAANCAIQHFIEGPRLKDRQILEFRQRAKASS